LHALGAPLQVIHQKDALHDVKGTVKKRGVPLLPPAAGTRENGSRPRYFVDARSIGCKLGCQITIDHRASHLGKQMGKQMGATWRPAHLLTFAHA